MKKSGIVAVFILLFLISTLSAKESQIAKDAKKALNSYVGLSELKKRGFNLKAIDNVNSMDEVYNLLLPFMIQNGVPLDNAIGFYDKQTNISYNFKQHYTVHFTDDYGTKEELLKKGYKEDEIFAYFSKGKNFYRGGKFSWEKAEVSAELGQWMMPQFPPLEEKNFIYFWPAFWTEQFYPDYWESALSKNYIILDLRLDQSGGDWQISQFFDYLEQKEYKGQLIIIIDSSATIGESLLTIRMTKWQNGKEVPRNLKFTSIGENTLGLQNFSGEWQRFETDQTIFWGVRKEINKFKKCEEGVGVMPEVWAESPEDIFKTIEVISGIKNFSSSVAVYQNFINTLSIQKNLNYYVNFKLPQFFFNLKDDKEFVQNLNDYLNLFSKFLNQSSFLSKNNLYHFYIPDSFYQIKDSKTFLETFSEFVQIQGKWYDFCFANIEKRSVIKGNLLNQIDSQINNLSSEQYIAELNKFMEKSIIQSQIEFEDYKGLEGVNSMISKYKVEFKPDVKEENRRLESLFLIFNKYDMLVSEGFDIHKMDYMTSPEEILNYIQPFFLSKDGYPRDLHTELEMTTTEGKRYVMKQTSRYIVFNDEYGTKEQLKKKGYVEDVTMFYYPYHDGKFWKNEKNWRTGKMIMAIPNYDYQETESKHFYYTTKKSVYFKFRNFPHPLGKGPEIENFELEEMIVKLSKETDKENVIFDISKNAGGDAFTSQRISEAVKNAGIKNVYIVIDKGAFSCGDHFPLCAKSYYFKEQNVTLVGYPTRGGTGSGDRENYIIDFPDFKLDIDIATSLQNSETKYEGWGATPDVYADNLTDALGAIRSLTGDNEIKPFETEQRKQYNKGKKRWLDDDLIFEINLN